MKWDAGQYDAVKAPQIDAGRELIALTQVREDDSILDLGCGTGKLTVELARLASRGSVMGIDPSEEMLEKARALAAAAENMSVVRTAAEDVAFESQFDLAFSNSAMQWVRDQPKAARSAHRALKSGGRIAFQLPAKDFCPDFFAAVENAITDLGYERFFAGWRSPWHFPAEAEYAATLHDAGFRSIDVFTREYALSFVSRSDVVAWWSSAGLRPYLAALPELAQPYFLEAFGESFERKRTARGSEFGFQRLFAFGRK